MRAAADRRHGQQVLREYCDIIAQLLELIVSCSVEPEELEEQSRQHLLTHVTVTFPVQEARCCSPSAWAQPGSGRTP